MGKIYNADGASVSGQPLTIIAQIIADGQGVISTGFNPSKGGVVPLRVAVNPQGDIPRGVFEDDSVPGNLGSFGVHD